MEEPATSTSTAVWSTLTNVPAPPRDMLGPTYKPTLPSLYSKDLSLHISFTVLIPAVNFTLVTDIWLFSGIRFHNFTPLFMGLFLCVLMLLLNLVIRCCLNVQETLE